MPVLADNIPWELKERPQWVAWRWRRSERGWTKVPVDPASGRPADSTDPETWGAFEVALDLASEHGLAGVGYVFSTDDPYGGIDLDGCRDLRTSKLAAWARGIVRAVGSYAEVSPSGTGVKVFFRGEVPGERRRKGQIEMYDRARFFTMTGNRLGDTPCEIADGREAVAKLYVDTFGAVVALPCAGRPHGLASTHAGVALADEELVARAATAANGAKFASLWSGDRAGYGSASEADLALCSMLAFWAGPDRERIDLLFRGSGLCRDKWLRRADYREKTIAEALKRGEFYGGSTAGKVYDLRVGVVSVD